MQANIPETMKMSNDIITELIKAVDQESKILSQRYTCTSIASDRQKV